MPLLKDDLRQQLTDLFTGRLLDPVTMHFFTQKSSVLTIPAEECQTCRECSELLSEVAALSEKLKLETHDFIADGEEAKRLGVERIPGLVMQGKNKGVLRYSGMPSGYEFGVIIEDLVDLSGGSTKLSQDSHLQLARLPAPVIIKVLVTPT